MKTGIYIDRFEITDRGIVVVIKIETGDVLVGDFLHFRDQKAKITGIELLHFSSRKAAEEHQVSGEVGLLCANWPSSFDELTAGDRIKFATE